MTLTQTCAAHRFHTPKNLTVEFHHIVPVSWQLHTSLSTPAPFPGIDQDGRGMLWDSRGTLICPTGHRNVHAWIEKLMHAVASAGSENLAAAQKAVLGRKRQTAEFPIALQALARYVQESNASLIALTQQGQWGQV